MKKIQVTQSTMPPFEEYLEEIKDIWDSHWMTNMGIKHQTLQHELEEYLDVPHVELLTNGHMALELTMQALGLTGEVITTPFTFASTTHAIVRNHLEPVFCDIDPKTYTMDVNQIESLITDKTSAIVPVHVYGNLCDVEAIQRIADTHHLKVVYDAAHSFGESWMGQGIGNFGDASCFSFHATKVFNTIEGGAVTFKDELLGKKLYQLKNFGIAGPETVNGIGANAKMNEFCAAMGICNLKHIQEVIAKRKRVFDRYQSHLKGINGFTTPRIQEDLCPNYSYYPILFDEQVLGVNRDDVYEFLEKNGIGARKYFYPLTTDFDCFKGQFASSKTPVAKRVSEQVLTLPLYDELPLEDVDRICHLILVCVKEHKKK